MSLNKKNKKQIKLAIELSILALLVISGSYELNTYIKSSKKADSNYTATAEVPGVEETETDGDKQVEEQLTIPEEVLSSDNEEIQKLIKLSENYPKAKEILSNLSAYPEELVKLASQKEETIDFVADYTNAQIPVEGRNISVKSDYTTGKIPLFIQWDKRWGYSKYGSNYIAVNGCGPTSLAMVIVGLTSDVSVNPKIVAEYSEKEGYYVDGVGTSWTLMKDGAAHFGIHSEELPLVSGAIKEALNSGHPVIASMNPGEFTDYGHFIVLTGVTEDGKVIVNDPDSKIRSKKLWDMDVFMEQTANLWEFSR